MHCFMNTITYPSRPQEGHVLIPLLFKMVHLSLSLSLSLSVCVVLQTYCANMTIYGSYLIPVSHDNIRHRSWLPTVCM